MNNELNLKQCVIDQIKKLFNEAHKPISKHDASCMMLALCEASEGNPVRYRFSDELNRISHNEFLEMDKSKLVDVLSYALRDLNNQ